MITDHTDLHVKLNLSLPWQKQHSREEGSLRQQIGHKFKEETSKVLHLAHSFVWCWKFDTSESISEIPRRFWNVVLQKDGEDRLADRVRNEEVLQRVKENKNNLQRIKRRIRHILRRNSLLKHVIEGEKEGRIGVTGRRGRRRKELLDDLQEEIMYWKLKEEALDCTLYRTLFRRAYGPVTWQTT